MSGRRAPTPKASLVPPGFSPAQGRARRVAPRRGRCVRAHPRPAGAAKLGSRGSRPRARHRPRLRHRPDAAHPRCAPRDRLQSQDHGARPAGARRAPTRCVPTARGCARARAVGETVEVVDTRARGFVNGVLRSLARSGPPFPLPGGDDVASVAVRTSHPDWIVRTFFETFGMPDAIATLELDNEAPPVTLRVNPMRSSVEAVTIELRRGGAVWKPGTLAPGALLVRHTGDLAALPAIAEGRATPQDQASQAIVAVLDPQPGERILDLASAPGGKATAAAERMGGDGLVVAADLHPGRVRTVLRAAERIGVRCRRHDRRRRPPPGGAPEGVRPRAPRRAVQRARRPASPARRALARRTDRRARPRGVAACAARGRRGAVRPGGRLVYAVCTLSKEETLGRR